MLKQVATVLVFQYVQTDSRHIIFWLAGLACMLYSYFSCFWLLLLAQYVHAMFTMLALGYFYAAFAIRFDISNTFAL